MTYIRTFVSIAVFTSAALATSAWAATDNNNVTQVAQAQSGSPGMHAGTTVPGYAGQMKAMQQMHDKMRAAKTPEERDALMAEQMKLMQGGMTMMGSMGGMDTGAATDRPADVAARQDMMEQRMNMMQLMMDRTQTVPTTK